MLELRIGDKILKGKVDFAFMKKAKEKYEKVKEQEYEVKGRTIKEEDRTPGYEVIYEGLLRDDYDALLYFWDCAFAGYEQAPSLDDIGQALSDMDIDEAFNQAFQALDNSGFFKRAVRAYWKKNDSIIKALESQAKTIEDVEEKELVLRGMEQYKEIKKIREEMNPEAKKKGKK